MTRGHRSALILSLPIATVVTTTLVSFLPLERSDFPLLQRWLAAPHVDAWWHGSPDPRALEEKYGPRIDGSEKTRVFIIEHDGRPIGWIQWYPWSDYPDHAAQLEAGPGTAGIDLAIGEIAYVGMGLGPIAIRDFIVRVISVDSAIAAVVADPEERNSRSLPASPRPVR